MKACDGISNDVYFGAGVCRQRSRLPGNVEKSGYQQRWRPVGQEALQYSAIMRVHDKNLPPDGKLTKAAFLAACKGDLYTPRKNDAGAPLKGSNSFTEGQAKDRALAAGFTSVSSMKKDGDGIWQGTAMQDGKSVPVAVDYKGNVVATAPNAK